MSNFTNILTKILRIIIFILLKYKKILSLYFLLYFKINTNLIYYKIKY